MRIPTELLKEVVDHATREYPSIACGLLLGPEGGDEISRVFCVRNAAQDKENKFDFYEDEFSAARALWEKDNLAYIGIYNSHPGSAASPSQSTIDEWFGSGIYLVVSLQDYQNPVCKLYWIREGQALEEPIEGASVRAAPAQPREAGATETGRHAAGAVVLGTDVQTHQPVVVSEMVRRQGTYVIGAPGMGKSTLLLNLILQDVAAGRGVVVLDPVGDLIADILCRVDLPAERVILLDPSDWRHPFGLNLFACPDPSDPVARSNTASYVMGIFEKLWGERGLHPSWGPQLAKILRDTTRLFVHLQRYTLVDLPKLLLDGDFRAQVLAEAPPDLREEWERDYNLRENILAYTSSTLNKVEAFTTHELLAPILGQGRSTIDIARLMEQDTVVLVGLPEGKIGTEGVSLLGSLLIGQILQAMLARADQPKGQRRSSSFYADEYQLFATTDFPRFFAEARKYGLQVAVAHQGRWQLNGDSKQAAMLAATKVAFRVSGQDASELRRDLDYRPPQPELPVVPDPIQSLLSRGHAHTTVRRFIESTRSALAGLDEAERQLVKPRSRYSMTDYDVQVEHAMYGTKAGRIESHRLVYRKINAYFVGMMEARIRASSDEEIEAIKDIGSLRVRALRGDREPIRRTLILRGPPIPKIPPNATGEQIWELGGLAQVQHDDWAKVKEKEEKQQQDFESEMRVREQGLVTKIPALCHSHPEDQLPASAGQLDIDPYLVDVVAVGRILARMPLTQSSAYGQADEVDLATLLTTLPKRTAVVRTEEEDGSVKDRMVTTDELGPCGDAEVVRQRQASIFAYAHDHYTTPIERVKEEIAARQATKSKDVPIRRYSET